MPTVPRIRRAAPRQDAAVHREPLPIPVIAGLRWAEGLGKNEKTWGEPRPYGALAVAWARDPDCVLIRWRPDERSEEREDWIEAKDIRRIDQ